MALPEKNTKKSVLWVARIVTAVVSMAGAESTLWLGGYPRWWAMDPMWGTAQPEFQSDPDLDWRLREGRFDLVWQDHPATSHYTNWRGGQRATAEQQPSGSLLNRPQVMFFGDSFVQGYELSDQETLPWIVQQRHPELQVSNFGVGNYSTYQSYLVMQRRIHGPVSAYYLINEFHEDRNAAAASWLRINRRPPDGFFFPYAVLSGNELEPHRSTGNVVWPLSKRLRIVALVEDYRDMAEAYFRVRNKQQLTDLLLAKMNDTVVAQGGRFTVILFDLSPQERNRLREFLRSQQIAFVDCDRPEMQDKSLRLPDGHPSLGLNSRLATWLEPLTVVSGQPSQAASVDERVVGKDDHRLARVAEKRTPVQ